MGELWVFPQGGHYSTHGSISIHSDSDVDVRGLNFILRVLGYQWPYL